MSLATSATTGNLIDGNDIGTTLDPTLPLGNSLDGILIDGATANTIGGNVKNANGQTIGPNVISGNTLEGIKITGASATKNVILGNFIGTDPTGTTDVGNRDGGIFIDASNNTIGGTAAGAGNVIAHNGKDLKTSGFGVTVDSGTGDSIRQNSIFLNSGAASISATTLRSTSTMSAMQMPARTTGKTSPTKQQLRITVSSRSSRGRSTARPAARSTSTSSATTRSIAQDSATASNSCIPST